jgi:hypothetical protein
MEVVLMEKNKIFAMVFSFCILLSINNVFATTDTIGGVSNNGILGSCMYAGWFVANSSGYVQSLGANVYSYSSGDYMEIALYNNTGDPYSLLAYTDNVTINNNGWNDISSGVNTSVYIENGTQYWLSIQTSNNPYIYFEDNTGQGRYSTSQCLGYGNFSNPFPNVSTQNAIPNLRIIYSPSTTTTTSSTTTTSTTTTSTIPLNTTVDYCQDDNILIKVNYVTFYVNDNQSRTIYTNETVFCEFGCDYVSSSCRIDPFLINLGIIAFIIGFLVMLFWLYRKV